MTPAPVKLAAVVVTFNRLAALKTTLHRLQQEAVDHIIVVDNASSDGTPEWLATLDDPRINTVFLSDNLGGAGGFEAGLKCATQTHDPDWTVLMDDDAYPQSGALAEFRTQIAKTDTNTGEYGAVAAAVFYPDGKLCEMNRPSRNPFWNLNLFAKTLLRGTRAGFHLTNDDFAPDAPTIQIDVASFVGYFVSRDAVARTGLPEGDLFIYGDDVLYSLRLRRAGIGMVFMPAVRFVHDCGTLGDGFVYRPLWKIYYHCRNGVSIARQAAGPVIFPLAITYYTLIWWRRQRGYTPAEQKLYRKMMWTGLRDGFLSKRGRNDAIHALSNGI